MLWGSDWPHVEVEGPMPQTTDQLDYLLAWIPDAALRSRVLMENPRVFYGF
jgi:predicted TIM-barrel fold metal-dependent hydrolase